jgi:hypothetical protein
LVPESVETARDLFLDGAADRAPRTLHKRIHPSTGLKNPPSPGFLAGDRHAIFKVVNDLE